PHFFFTESVIEPRKPLASTARRAGWVGCNILVGQIPPDGRLKLVTEGAIANRQEVRDRYERVRPIADLEVDVRGWALDVLRIVRELKGPEFTLVDVYRHEGELAELH